DGVIYLTGGNLANEGFGFHGNGIFAYDNFGAGFIGKISKACRVTGTGNDVDLLPFKSREVVNETIIELFVAKFPPRCRFALNQHLVSIILRPRKREMVLSLFVDCQWESENITFTVV